MNKRKALIFLGVSLIVLAIVSCANVAKEVLSWQDVQTKEEAFGNYHFLEEDGTKVYLPEEFERNNLSEYQKILDSILPEDIYQFEINRLNDLQDIEGGFALFYDKESRSSCSVNTGQYLPMSKAEAQQFLGLVQLSYEEATRDTDVTITKLTAKYSGNPENYSFKMVYKIENSNSDATLYYSSYIITSNWLSVVVLLSTPFEVHFDPYINKMVIR